MRKICSDNRAQLIAPEQARELMRKIGRDRDKLNEVAAKLFRR